MTKDKIMEFERISNAIKGAAWEASKKARMFDTKLIVVRDGKIVEETPDEFERFLSSQK